MDKGAIRQRVWDELESSGEARFPFPPHGRIPNFAGADGAAEGLAGLDAWEEAEVVKANPDAPQLPVRRRALRAGKTLYVAVPRLAEEKPFYRLDPDEVDDVDDATTVGGVAEAGHQVGVDEMEAVDLVVSGSVAVTREGARIGKGEGYSDLEFALLRTAGLVDDDTTTATTVHPVQVLDRSVPAADHDVPMDVVVTPDGVVREARSPKPDGIRWEELSGERIEEIPPLQLRSPDRSPDE